MISSTIGLPIEPDKAAARHAGTFSRLLGAAFLCMLTLPAIAPAQERSSSVPSNGLPARYPAGSIQSVEAADRALADAAAERAAIEARFSEDESACYTKFFANACRDTARERRRVALAEVRPIEVEAQSFKRHANVAERDKALAEKNARDEKERTQREAQQTERSKDRAERQAKSADSADGPPAPARTTEKTARPAPPERKQGNATSRVEQHEARLKRLQEEDVANAQKRADNIAAYERKVREAQERQREIAARKLEKEKERANKNK